MLIYVLTTQDLMSSKEDGSNPSDHILDFGKHKGKMLSDIIKSDPHYILWLSGIKTVRTIKKEFADAHKTVSENHGESVKHAKKLMEGRCFYCFTTQCTKNCTSMKSRQYHYHPYGKRD